MSLSRLGRHLHDELDRADVAADDEAARIRERLLESATASRPRVARAQPKRMVAAAFALACAAGLPILYWAFRSPQALTFAIDRASGAEISVEASGSGRYVSSRENDTRVAFSDGSEVVLERESRARVESTGAHGGRVVLERGTTRARIVHADRTEWHFVAGPFDVQVTGTAFALTWDATTDAATVVMTEGSVVVRGCGSTEGKVVTRGETLRAQCSDRPLYDVSLASEHAAVIAPPPATAPVRTIEDLPRATTAESARAASTRAPAPRSADAPVVSADDLWTQGSAARDRGDFAAVKRLRAEIRARFPRDPRAPQAAFELGQLAFDVEHDFAGAERSFARYLQEAPAGSLAREALGRSMEARARVGHREGARALATEYQARFPGGPHGALAAQLIDEAQP